MVDGPSIDLLMEEADNDLNSGVLASNFTENEDGFDMSNEDTKTNQTSSRKSIVHKYLVNGGILCLFNLEHGGEQCRILHIAVVMQQIHSFYTKSAHQFLHTISFPKVPRCIPSILAATIENLLCDLS